MSDPIPFEKDRVEMTTLDTGTQNITDWCGFQFTGPVHNFWKITCPCGVTVSYPLNKLPEKDTKHPCKNPAHWTVRFKQSTTPLCLEGVIYKLLALIPVDQTVLRTDLIRLHQKSLWVASTLQPNYWNRAVEVLVQHIPAENMNEWQKDVLSIMQGKDKL